ncbi:MAG: hypothetical protein AB7K04_09825 [Pseudorhodoplanes sp.]
MKIIIFFGGCAKNQRRTPRRRSCAWTLWRNCLFGQQSVNVSGPGFTAMVIAQAIENAMQFLIIPSHERRLRRQWAEKPGAQA